METCQAKSLFLNRKAQIYSSTTEQHQKINNLIAFLIQKFGQIRPRAQIWDLKELQGIMSPRYFIDGLETTFVMSIKKLIKKVRLCLDSEFKSLYFKFLSQIRRVCLDDEQTKSFEIKRNHPLNCKSTIKGFQVTPKQALFDKSLHLPIHLNFASNTSPSSLSLSLPNRCSSKSM